jgi:hypothetical protein
MASVSYRGDAKIVAQVNTITPANVNIGNTFTVTINGKAITFTATAATVANVTAGLVALLQARTEGEFTEITWADATTHITATAVTAGKPFTQTSSAAGGTATNVTATATASSGPNDVSLGANWSGGAVPSSTDDVTVDGDNDLLWNLDQNTIALASLTIPSTFTGKIGLPQESDAGYYEYRETYWKIGATTVTIGRGTATGSSRIKLNTGTGQTAVTIHNTANAEIVGLGAVIWKGTHASNVVDAIAGSLSVAPFGGEVATIATLRAEGANVECSAGVTLTTVTHAGSGSLLIASAATTVNQNVGAGPLTIVGSGAVATLHCLDSTTSYQGSGTITTLNVAPNATIKFEDKTIARTVTNTNLYADSNLYDRSNSVTFTNPIATPGCSIGDVNAQFGVGRTYAVA